MKLPNLSIASLLLILIFVQSCKKETSDSEPSSSTTLATIRDYLTQCAPQTQTFTINAQFPTTIRTDHGTLIKFSPNAFESTNGQLVSGDVEIQITAYMTRAEMILGNKPTISNGEILVSGGQLNIEAYQNGTQLQESSTFSLEVFVPTNDPDPLMTLFTGTENQDGSVDWQQESDLTLGFSSSDSAFYANCNYLSGSIVVLQGSNLIVTYNEGIEPVIEHTVFITSSCGDFVYGDEEIVPELINAEASSDCTVNFYLTDSWSDGWQDAFLTIQVGTQTLNIAVPSEGCEPNVYNYVYQVVTGHLGYINLDYFWNNPNSTTTIYANYPESFDCDNTICFLIFPEILSVVDMTCNMGENGTFMNGVPEGTEAQICALSYDPETDIFYSAIEPITLSPELTSDLIFTETTAAEFEAYVDGL